MNVSQTRTNFYKLSMNQLEVRIERLNSWVTKHGKNHPDFTLAYQALTDATDMYAARASIIADPKGTRKLQDVLDVFWGSIPLKYNPTADEVDLPVEDEVVRIEDTPFI